MVALFKIRWQLWGAGRFIFLAFLLAIFIQHSHILPNFCFLMIFLLKPSKRNVHTIVNVLALASVITLKNLSLFATLWSLGTKLIIIGHVIVVIGEQQLFLLHPLLFLLILKVNVPVVEHLRPLLITLVRIVFRFDSMRTLLDGRDLDARFPFWLHR